MNGCWTARAMSLRIPCCWDRAPARRAVGGGLPVSLFRLRGGISFPPWPRFRRPPYNAGLTDFPWSGLKPWPFFHGPSQTRCSWVLGINRTENRASVTVTLQGKLEVNENRCTYLAKIRVFELRLSPWKDIIAGNFHPTRPSKFNNFVGCSVLNPVFRSVDPQHPASFPLGARWDAILSRRT